MSRFIFVAALCSAIVGTVVAAAYITFLYVRKTNPASLGDVAVAFFVGILFAAIPAGLFGLVAGAAGSGWLVSRRAKFKSRGDVARAGAVTGAILGGLYPAVSLLLHWTSAEDGRTLLGTCALGGVVGAFCGWLFGRLFGSMILNNSSKPKAEARSE